MFDTMKTAELEVELVTLASRIASAQCRFLRLLAEFDAREGWAGPGIRSCTHWLSWRVGLSLRTGRDHVRVARALRSLPLVTDAFAAGRLSYAKVRAITRLATPKTEQAMLELAIAGTASQVERAVRAARIASTPPAERTARRAVVWRWDEDGCLVLRATLPPEDGARLIGALEAQLAADQPVDPPVETCSRSPDQSVSHDHGCGSAEPVGVDGCGAAEPVGVDGCGAAEPACGAPAADDWAARVHPALEHAPGAALDRVAARRADALLGLLAPDAGQHQVTVHLEVATGEVRLDEGSPTAASTARRLACDARVRTLIKDREGNPLYLGRSHRGVTETQRAALRIRDQRRCQFPGCDHTKYLHAHHIVHWWDGGPTDIDNLVLLCSFHHRLVHDRPYRLARLRGRLRVWRSTGEEVTAQRPLAAVGEIVTPLDLHVETHVAPDAIVPDWAGERLDLDAVLDAILPVNTAA